MEIEIPPFDAATPPTTEERDSLISTIETTIANDNDDQQRMRDVLSAMRALVFLYKHQAVALEALQDTQPPPQP